MLQGFVCLSYNLLSIHPSPCCFSCQVMPYFKPIHRYCSSFISVKPKRDKSLVNSLSFYKYMTSEKLMVSLPDSLSPITITVICICKKHVICHLVNICPLSSYVKLAIKTSKMVKYRLCFHLWQAYASWLDKKTPTDFAMYVKLWARPGNECAIRQALRKL